VPFTNKTKPDQDKSELLRTKGEGELRAMLRKAGLRTFISRLALPTTAVIGGMGTLLELVYRNTPAAIVIAAGTVAVMAGAAISFAKVADSEKKIREALFRTLISST